jgi:hypothetical protein
LTARNAAHQIEHENEQVVGVARGRRQRFLGSNRKIERPPAFNRLNPATKSFRRVS